MSEGAHGPPPDRQMTFADIMQRSWWRIWGPHGVRQIAADNQSVDRSWNELPRLAARGDGGDRHAVLSSSSPRLP